MSPFLLLVVAQLATVSPGLTGPWRFHLGDDPTWSAPAFDDRTWEQVDLTAPPGAHDGDVGHPNYVPGWGARGHPGAQGFGWYRLRVPGPTFVTLPPLVDDGYELYLNGTRVARTVDFSHSPPAIYSVRPGFIELGPGDSLLAVRVWMGPGSWEEPPDEESGGMHVAPISGTREQAAAEVHAEGRTLFWGYVVDAVEPLLMLLLAWRWRSRPWLATALLATALLRGNQAFFYWLQLESTGVFDIVRNIVLFPFGLMAWTWAWSETSKLGWTRRAALATALTESACALASRHHQGHAFFLASVAARCVFLGLGAVQLRKLAGLERAVMGLVFMGYFARELSLLHVPGIWFPFGVGVSRTQFGYALLIGLLAFYPYAGQRRSHPALADG